jgi:hypothetical protein
MACYLMWTGEHAEAAPHVERLIQLNDAHFGAGGRPEGRLLLARLCRARGDLAAAREHVRALRRHQEEAPADALLLPPEAALLDVVALAADDAPDADWDAAIAHARELLPGQELIEALWARGETAAARGDATPARAALEAALEACGRIPSVMRPRLAEALARLNARSGSSWDRGAG